MEYSAQQLSRGRLWGAGAAAYRMCLMARRIGSGTSLSSTSCPYSRQIICRGLYVGVAGQGEGGYGMRPICSRADYGWLQGECMACCSEGEHGAARWGGDHLP